MNATAEHKQFVARTLLPIYKASPCGRDKMLFKVQAMNLPISKRDIEYFLKNLETHQLHLQRPRAKSILPITATYPSQRYEIDLVETSNINPVLNRGTRYLLTCIDVYSKYAWVIPITNKRSNTVSRAFLDQIYAEYPCSIVQSDNGPEFNGITDNVDKHIKIPPYSPQVNGQIERFNGTIKRMIYLHMTESGTREYVNELPQMVEEYNDTVHSTHGFTPEQVFSRRRRYDMKKNLHVKEYDTLQRGDKVRIRLERVDSNWRKNIFKKKKYLPNWTRQIYTIKSKSKERPGPNENETEPTYTLVEFGRERFLEQDLLKVNENELIRTERRPEFERIVRVREPDQPRERVVRERRAPGNWWL